MAAKWRAQQRKQRWEHSTVLLPPSLVARLSQQEPNISRLAGFTSALRQWTGLANTYEQVAGAKRLVKALESLVGIQRDAFSLALSVYVEVLFQEGSKPVHRTMLSPLVQMNYDDSESLVGDAFERCCVDYGVGGCKERRFALVAVGLSLASLPKPGLLKDVVQRCAEVIALSASFDVAEVLRRAQDGENPIPALMEDCQDAMSTVYYMIQKSPDKFHVPPICSEPHRAGERTAYNEVVSTALDVLQTTLMSRDCVVAAAVCLCAAAQMCISQSDLTLMLAEALFPLSCSHFEIITQQQGLRQGSARQGMLEAAICKLRGTSMAAEALKFTEFGRLCVLRGLLTAVPREVLSFCLLKRTTGREEMEIWTLLYDGILQALCSSCEISFDSHFKFHAMTALQICLQQIKASILGNITATAVEELQRTLSLHEVTCSPFMAFSLGMTRRIMQIIWNNWEDPLNQTVRQVQMVFDLLADLQSLPYVQRQSKAHEGTKSFLHRIANDLLTVGGHRKGRYVPLASLALRIGAKNLLEMSPDLLFQTVSAMSDDGVCCAASSFLRLVLERLRDECWNSVGVAEGNLLFRRLWVPPMLAGLVSGNPRRRINLHTYALPVGLEIDGDVLLQMLGFVLDGSTLHNVPAWEDLHGAVGMPNSLTQDERVAAFVSLIKVARSLALMKNEIKTSSDAAEMEISVKGRTLYAPVVLLELALTHLEEGLRVDAAEIVCLNPKTAVMLSPLELHLLKLAMPLNMRCSSTSFRMKWTSLLKKFFNRVRIATDRQIKLDLAKVGHRNGITTEQGNEADLEVERLRQSVVTVSEMQSFMQWLTRLLIASLYPSAPYERKYMAMEILNVMLDVWSMSQHVLQSKFSPYGKELLSADYTMILLGAVVDSWDRLRESAFKILVRYPTPLPGLEAQGTVEEVLNWGKVLASSPRVRESDAGALVLRLIFRKYVCELGWRVKLYPEPKVFKLAPSAGDEIVQYLESLNDWLEAGIVEGEKDLVKACRHSLVHGVLLTFRYAIQELDWMSDAVRTNVSGLRRAFRRLFELLLKVTSLALWVVSVDALNIQEKQLGSSDEDDSNGLPFGEAGEIDMENKGIDGDNTEEGDDAALLAPLEQMIMVACWLSMKEVSLLLGTVAREAPLPGCSYSARSKSSQNCELQSTEELEAEPFIMLDSQQLEAIGYHFLQVLLAMKHNGAIDKTRVGFVALCNRLLLSSDTRLSKMPEIWMQQLMRHTSAEGQSLDDLLRRSAGIPASFLGLFLAEPDGAPKKLLPMALSWLINNINKFISKVDSRADDTLGDGGAVEPCNGRIESPDEGVVPVVHAFNTLRVTFNDTNLATDTSGFCAEALIVSIEGFSSRYWQVRNSATLAFTAILHRMVGFLNVHKQATARRAITGFEFFSRYPALHPFLLKELKFATAQLEHGVDRNTKGVRANKLHPSLAPVLIILSRLKPSIVNTRVEDWLSPSAFMPYVMRCATQCNFKVRVLASRALAPLVTSEDLLNVLRELSDRLPVGTALKEPSSSRTISGLSSNAIHGVLLQLSSLLKSNCLDLPDQEKQGEIVVEIFRKISGCTWLGSTRFWSCFTVIAAFLHLLEGLLEVAQHCQQVLSVPEAEHQIRFVLLKLCAESMSQIDGTARLWDSTQVDLRGAAAQIYFSTILRGWLSSNLENRSSQYRNMDQTRCMMQASICTDGSVAPFTEAPSPSDFYMILKQSLSDSMYEVRLATVKVLKMFSRNEISKLKSSSSASRALLQLDAKELNGLLIERLYAESHPRCIKRILEVFLNWDLLTIAMDPALPGQCSGMMQQDFVKLWYTLLNIYKSSKVSRTREYAICCLGNCLQRISIFLKKSILQSASESPLEDSQTASFDNISGMSNIGQNWGFFYEVFDAWDQLISRHSKASQPVTIRRAVASAIIASKCLGDAKLLRELKSELNPKAETTLCKVKWYSKTILSIWSVSIKLLEDEDVSLRQQLALGILDVISSSSENSHLSAVPAQVEKVLETSLSFLKTQFENCDFYFDFLASWVMGEEKVRCGTTQDADLVRKLFDKELDNHHEEELLVFQLCCLHIRTFVASQDMGLQPASRTDFIVSWQRKFFKQAVVCAQWCLKLEQHTKWVGGITNHQDAFKSLYRTLLGLLVLAVPIPKQVQDAENEDLRGGLLELKRALKQVPLSPMISNIFLRLLYDYEQCIGTSLGADSFKATMGDSFCSNFEPFFLLR